ncbi:MAG: hypothetical protein KA354_16685, partial [Phycisphaerae bacterium]|nr:hypothetical protein [Phycisphaerae bacterium]
MILPTILTVAISWAASAGDEPLRVEHAGMVAPDVVGMTIMAGRAEYGRQVAYTRKAGDAVNASDIHRFVWRDGKVIGTLVGKQGDTLCTMDLVIGDKLDPAWADQAASYGITSPDDSRYRTPQKPACVYRKTKPSDLAMIGPYQFDSPTESVIYLKLAAALQVGKTYVVSFNNSELPAQRLNYDPAKLRSEAVHVNQVGFRRKEPAKIAFLSCWMGTGGGLKYEGQLPFSVLDDATGQSVFEGTATLSKAASVKDEDAYKKNYNGTDVYALDFTPLDKPGKYRVCVAGLGCSYPFAIEDDVWRKAFITSARGFYHQRSGIALGAPYATFTRPRPFHPDDGLKV